jgi:hypothetical protein
LTGDGIGQRATCRLGQCRFTSESRQVAAARKFDELIGDVAPGFALAAFSRQMTR